MGDPERTTREKAEGKSIVRIVLDTRDEEESESEVLYFSDHTGWPCDV